MTSIYKVVLAEVARAGFELCGLLTCKPRRLDNQTNTTTNVYCINCPFKHI